MSVKCKAQKETPGDAWKVFHDVMFAVEPAVIWTVLMFLLARRWIILFKHSRNGLSKVSHSPDWFWLWPWPALGCSCASPTPNYTLHHHHLDLFCSVTATERSCLSKARGRWKTIPASRVAPFQRAEIHPDAGSVANRQTRQIQQSQVARLE